MMTKRLLFDRLEGGILDSKECDAGLRRESMSISLTDAQPEENFRMFGDKEQTKSIHNRR